MPQTEASEGSGYNRSTAFTYQEIVENYLQPC